MTELCKKLEDWGCDIPGAMRRFLNDEDLYAQCLDTMLKDKNFDLLKSNLAKNDITEAFNAAHSLKGTLGNMSLTPLYDIIIKIVEILRAKSTDGVPELLTELLSQKAKLEELVYS